jgi:lipopolysaccharide biosynthesis glycosyltransferase
MRRCSFLERIATWLKANDPKEIVLLDQQLINCEFWREIDLLPLVWNVHGELMLRRAARAKGPLNDFTEADFCQVRSTPAILHFAGKRKPWNYPLHPFTDVWFAYLGLTEFRELVPRPQVKNFQAWVKKVKSMWLFQRRLPTSIADVW